MDIRKALRTTLIPAIFLSTVAQADVPKVAADIPPVQALLADLMSGVGAPDLIIPPATDPHHFSLRPSQARVIRDADLIVWIGPGLAPQLGDAFESLAADTQIIELAGLDATITRSARDLEEISASDEHDHAHDHDHDHDHEDGAADPHIWLDPANATAWIGPLAEALVSLDPQNEDTYRANAAALEAGIRARQERLSARFENLGNRRFLAAHDSYQYFEARFDLDLVAAISLSDSRPPGPATLAKVRSFAQSADTNCLAADIHTSDALLRTVAEGTALKIVQVDQLGYSAPASYPDFMETLAETFLSCMDGGGD